MGSIFVVGAGLSKTCGIATDLEMLDQLNPLLRRTPSKEDIAFRVAPERWKTTIESLREQLFHYRAGVGFELFMSTLWAAKYSAYYLELDRNIFREEERELQRALKRYLKDCVRRIDWGESGGRTILELVRSINWNTDFVITFNYDQLLEAAAARSGLRTENRILHLHGAMNERTLAWPIYAKFAYRTTKTALGKRWKRAFQILRGQREIDRVDRLIFIGYSMPSSDLEALTLFLYTDWYNSRDTHNYSVMVVNPSDVQNNYAFLRKVPEYRQQTLADWLRSSKTPPAGQPNLDQAT